MRCMIKDAALGRGAVEETIPVHPISLSYPDIEVLGIGTEYRGYLHFRTPKPVKWKTSLTFTHG